MTTLPPRGHPHGNVCPFPQPLRLVADGADILEYGRWLLRASGEIVSDSSYSYYAYGEVYLRE